ncbi:unnamed protein product [[Candida] boidinii]|uniref:Unnamed protein product n=1 Tax=Candida boidinii TaxID=5477 RepID=A0A9W6T205_CANBO|nr:unnamed protein product [[Candida] boidinii]GMF98865.1 unnamed protein product [[Candida] boidinii]
MVNVQAALISIQSISIAVNTPSLIFHIRSKNVPAIMLIVCIEIMLIKYLVDTIIWGGSDYKTVWDGKVWCDIMVRLQIGAPFGCLCSLFAMLLNLYIILRADKLTLKWFNHKKIKLAIELLICLFFPILIMGISYFAQVMRYSIFKCSGCQFPSTLDSVSVLVFTAWLLVWSALCLIMAALTLFEFFKKRKDTKDIVHCNSGLSMSKFVRLLIFCFSILFIMVPFVIYSAVNLLAGVSPQFYNPSYHTKIFWNVVIRYPYDYKVDIERYKYIISAFFSFFLFGFGSDAIDMYKSGLNKFKPTRIMVEKFERYQEEKRNRKVENHLGKLFTGFGGTTSSSINSKSKENGYGTYMNDDENYDYSTARMEEFNFDYQFDFEGQSNASSAKTNSIRTKQRSEDLGSFSDIVDNDEWKRIGDNLNKKYEISYDEVDDGSNPTDSNSTTASIGRGEVSVVNYTKITKGRGSINDEKDDNVVEKVNSISDTPKTLFTNHTFDEDKN